MVQQRFVLVSLVMNPFNWPSEEVTGHERSAEDGQCSGRSLNVKLHCTVAHGE